MKKKFILPMVTGLAASGLLPVSSYARTKINNVSVKLTAENYSESYGADVGAESSSDKYSVSSVETYDEYNELSSSNNDDKEDDGFNEDNGEEKEKTSKYANRYVITLTTDDTNYFNTTKSKSIHVNGLGADFVSASRRDNGTTLIITVDIDNDAILGAPTDISRDAEKPDYVRWDPVHAASWYKLRIRDPQGKLRSVPTYCTKYNIRAFLVEPGTYEVTFAPQSDKGKTTGWSNSLLINVTQEEAEKNIALNGVTKVVTYKDGVEVPGNAITTYEGAGWKQESNGKWWYVKEDGTFPQGGPIPEYGQVEYFFDQNGYLITGKNFKWQGTEYSADEDGHVTVYDNSGESEVKEESD